MKNPFPFHQQAGKAMRYLIGAMLLSISFCAPSPTLYGQQKNNLAEQYQQMKKDPTFRVILEPQYKVLISSQIDSPVKHITKRMGDSFNEGDLLIQLNDEVFETELKRAKANLLRAQAELEAKNILFQDNVASTFEIREAEAYAAIAEAELAKAQQKYNATKILAPFNGKVVDLNIEEYELAQRGKHIIQLVEDQTLRAHLLVPSTYLSKISNGQAISITVKETGQPITARISRIGAVIDPASSTIKIEAIVDNRNNALKSGMSGTATLTLSK